MLREWYCMVYFLPSYIAYGIFFIENMLNLSLYIFHHIFPSSPSEILIQWGSIQDSDLPQPLHLSLDSVNQFWESWWK